MTPQLSKPRRGTQQILSGRESEFFGVKEDWVRLIAIAFEITPALTISQSSYVSYKSVVLFEALASVKSMEHYQGRGDGEAIADDIFRNMRHAFTEDSLSNTTNFYQCRQTISFPFLVLLQTKRFFFS